MKLRHLGKAGVQKVVFSVRLPEGFSNRISAGIWGQSPQKPRIIVENKTENKQNV